MIGSQGIHDLSRAAGDESLRHLQRVNKDGHNEQDKGGHRRGGKDSEDEKEHPRDSYEKTAEEINTKPAPSTAAPVTSTALGNDESEKDAAQAVNAPAQSIMKTRKKTDDANDVTPGGDNDHIDLIG